MKILSERLKWLREKHRFAQKEVADKAEISLSGYQKIEYGSRVASLEVLMNIADLYDESLDFIMGRTHIRKCMVEHYNEILENYKVAMVDDTIQKNDEINELYEQIPSTSLSDLESIFALAEINLIESYGKYINMLIDIPHAEIREDKIINMSNPRVEIQQQLMGDEYALILYSNIGLQVKLYESNDYENVKEVEATFSKMLRKTIPRNRQRVSRVSRLES